MGEFLDLSVAGELPRLDHHLLVSVMPDPAVVVDVNGTIVSANDLVASVFGYDPEELIGKPVEILVPERRRHPHRQHRAGYMAAPRQRTMGAGLNLFGRRKDGAEVPVDISLAPLPGDEDRYILAAIRDISVLKSAASSQAHLVAVIESSIDGIISTSIDGMITSWNPGATRVLGYEADDVVGRHISLLLMDDGSEEFEILLAGAAEGRSIGPLDTVWRRVDGQPVDVAISVSSITGQNGEKVGFSAIVRDVTERKLAEAELRRLFHEEQQRERWQAATSEIRLAMLSGTSSEETLTLICEHTRDLCDVEAAIIGLVEGDELAVAATSGSLGAPPAAELRMPIVEQAISSRAPQLVVAARPSGADEGRAEDNGSSSGSTNGPCACAPILLEDSIAGVLVAIDPRRSETMDPLGLTVFEGLAGQAALALELGRAREDSERLMLITDRERIARDLHDLVIQRLFATGMALEGSLRLVRDPQVASRVSAAVDALDATVREIRTVIFELESPSGVHTSVRSMVLHLVDEVTEALGFEPTVRFEGPVDAAISDDVRPHLLAAVRETLSNTSRHAMASAVSIDVEVGAIEAVLRVSDNGIGVDLTLEHESGLANLRGRAEELGGSMELLSSEAGTTVIWQVPLEAPGG
jgi:PAS domain S-box-containing protein